MIMWCVRLLCALFYLLSCIRSPCASIRTQRPSTVYDVYEPYFPNATRGVVIRTSETAAYNHDSSIVFWKGLYYAIWNANTIPQEGYPNQYNLLSTSKDGLVWQQPVKFLSTPETSNNPVPCNECTQWQPNFVVVADQLWVSWCQHSNDKYNGTYVSVLALPGGQWQNHQLLFDGQVQPTINGEKWFVFPTQDPVILSNGRIIAPVTATVGHSDSADAVMFTDDLGKTWSLSTLTRLPGEDNKMSQWEPTCFERNTTTIPNGTVVMLARNNKGSPNPKPTEKLVFSTSTNYGRSWSELNFVPLESIRSRSHVWGKVVNERNIMVLNDVSSVEERGITLTVRQNIALFVKDFSSSSHIDFLPGVSLTDFEPVVAYPQLAMLSDAEAIMIYSQGREYRSIRTVKFTLPAAGRHYIFTRNNVQPFCARPVIESDRIVLMGLQTMDSMVTELPSVSHFSMGIWINIADGPTVSVLDSRKAVHGVALVVRLNDHKNLTICLNFHDTNNHCLQTQVLPLFKWTYVGLSVNTTSGLIEVMFNNEDMEQVLFNNTLYQTFQFAPLRVGGPFGGSLFNFTGSLRYASIYDGVLTQPQHRGLANQYVNSVDLPPFPGPTAEITSANLLFRLDPGNQTEFKRSFVLPKPCAHVSKYNDTTQSFDICGRGSASVEIPPNALDNAFKASFSAANIENGAILVTLGDGDNHVRFFNDNGTWTWIDELSRRVPCGAVSSVAEFQLESVPDMDSNTRTTIMSTGQHTCTIQHSTPRILLLFFGNAFADQPWLFDEQVSQSCFSVAASVSTAVFTKDR